MFSKSAGLIVALIAIIVLLFTFSGQTHPIINDDLLFIETDGDRKFFKEYKGQPVLITFWSPTCVVCMHEVDELNTLYSQSHSGKKFELLAISMYYDRPDSIVETSSKAGMKYPVFLDLDRQIASAFGNVIATPTSFLLNKNGEIVYRHSGKLDFDLIQQKITKLMG